MIIETLHLNAMLVIVTLVILGLAIIWPSNDLLNVILKVFLYALAFWCAMNTVVLLWFS